MAWERDMWDRHRLSPTVLLCLGFFCGLIHSFILGIGSTSFDPAIFRYRQEPSFGQHRFIIPLVEINLPAQLFNDSPTLKSRRVKISRRSPLRQYFGGPILVNIVIPSAIRCYLINFLLTSPVLCLVILLISLLFLHFFSHGLLIHQIIEDCQFS